VRKTVSGPYAPGNRGLWLKVKCLNREEFVVAGCDDTLVRRAAQSKIDEGRYHALPV
jgi:bifunctional non-homologous end joining protein LigD